VGAFESRSFRSQAVDVRACAQVVAVTGKVVRAKSKLAAMARDLEQSVPPGALPPRFFGKSLH
jgi:hypothetical protein